MERQIKFLGAVERQVLPLLLLYSIDSF